MLVLSYGSRLREERPRDVGDALRLADVVRRQVTEAGQFEAPGIGQDARKAIQRRSQIGRTSIASQQKRLSACQPEALNGSSYLSREMAIEVQGSAPFPAIGMKYISVYELY